MTQRTKIGVAIGCAVVVLLGGGAGVFAFTHTQPNSTTQEEDEQQPVADIQDEPAPYDIVQKNDVATNDVATNGAISTEQLQPETAQQTTSQNANGTVFETPYYTITLPDSWAGKATFRYDDSIHDMSDQSYPQTLKFGHITDVMRSDGPDEYGFPSYFSVWCSTEGLNPQGAYFGQTLQEPSTLPGYYVHVFFGDNELPMTDDAKAVRLNEYIGYVTIK